ncbi:MAG: DUF5658 family protein [Gammaproteobacteria bacterium]|nr:DUF5658 family protein [Gammaproteobacteria bacterium]
MAETLDNDQYADSRLCMRGNYGQDRRSKNSLRTAWHSVYRNRRTAVRRIDDDAVNVYLDRHEPWLVYMALGALLLSITDAFFTLALLQHGSYEMNPFMDYFIQKDIRLFFIVKFSMTATCILFVLMHKNFLFLRLFKGYHVLFTSFVLYSLLISYELSMLIQLGYFGRF